MNIVAMHHNPTLNNSNTPVILAASITDRRRISAHLKLVSLILISHAKDKFGLGVSPVTSIAVEIFT